MPSNPLIKALRFHAKVDLYKIRTCRNIAGEQRELDPYAAPTDASTGLPSDNKQGGVWIMNAGTSTAHLMTPGS